MQCVYVSIDAIPYVHTIGLSPTRITHIKSCTILCRNNNSFEIFRIHKLLIEWQSEMLAQFSADFTHTTIEKKKTALTNDS